MIYTFWGPCIHLDSPSLGPYIPLDFFPIQQLWDNLLNERGIMFKSIHSLRGGGGNNPILHNYKLLIIQTWVIGVITEIVIKGPSINPIQRSCWKFVQLDNFATEGKAIAFSGLGCDTSNSWFTTIHLAGHSYLPWNWENDLRPVLALRAVSVPTVMSSKWRCLATSMELQQLQHPRGHVTNICDLPDSFWQAKANGRSWIRLTTVQFT